MATFILAFLTTSFFLSKLKPIVNKFSGNAIPMLHNPSIVDLKHYASPEFKSTGSEVNERFVLASFVKGSKDFEFFAQSGFFYRKLVDSANCWSAFDLYEIYPSDDDSSIVSTSPILLVLANCSDSAFVSCPCSPSTDIELLSWDLLILSTLCAFARFPSSFCSAWV
jgi:hypothetical protein